MTKTAESSIQPTTFFSKFRSNSSAFISFCVVTFLFIISIFAYFIIPDNSPNANQQFPSIALSKPGFKANVLKLPRQGQEIKNTFISQWMNGKRVAADFYVYETIKRENDAIYLTNYYGREQIILLDDFLLGKLDGANAEGSASLSSFTSQKSFILGTDKFGRDIFSRIILGIRVSMLVGAVAVIISLFMGILMGSLAGFLGGIWDQLIMLLINVNWSIPTLLMVFAIVLAFDRGLIVIFIAVGLTMWVELARIVRGQVMLLKQEQFVVAARNMGMSIPKILFVHILPNIIGPVLVMAAANFSTAVLVEAGLSFIGFGVEPPTPSIGNMLNEHYGYAMTGKLFLAVVPALTLMILVLSFNLVGAGLRDAFDVKKIN